MFTAPGDRSGRKRILSSELDYVEFTSNVNITATTEGTANTIVTSNPITFDGKSVVLIEFFAPYTQCGATAGSSVVVWLYQDGTSIGSLGITQNNSNLTRAITHAIRRMTPSNGSHTYSIRAHRGTSDGLVAAGAGGAATTLPGYIRITRAN